MATKKYATVEQIQGLEAQMKNIMAALATLTEKPEAPKAAKPVEHKANVPIIGKPSKVYVERDWVWCQWEQKPTAKTIERLKAAGWKYSVKRKAWHKVNA